MDSIGEIFEEKGFQRSAKLLSEDPLEIELTITEPETVRETINALNHNFNGKKKIIVNCRIDLSSRSFQKLDFAFCEFREELIFNNCNFQQSVSLSNSILLKGVDFSRSTFNHNVRFQRTKFIKTSKFKSTIFKKLVDFYFAEFHESQQFHLSEFEGTAIFSNCKFFAPIQFLQNKVQSSSSMSFENSYFEHGLDLSRANFWCTIQFWGVDFSKTQVPNLKMLGLYQNDNFREPEPKKELRAVRRIRETFRLIKNNFRSQGNSIEALNFHQLELQAYEVELKIDNGRFHEILLLKLNNLSNKHGRSWWQAFKFTTVTTLIFYLVFLSTISDELEFELSFDAFGNTFKHYIELLNLTFWDYKPFGVDNQPIAYIILFISRLFIGYGYYQFIQAFRKYGKN